MKPMIHTQQALTAHYARYRARLCQADGRLAARLQAGAMVRVAFSRLMLAYDLILLDAFGVLYQGAEAIPGAVEGVERIHRAGRPVLILSNNASQSPARLLAQLGHMGFSLSLPEIVTSGMAVQPFVAASPFRNLPYYLVGTSDSGAAYAPDPAHLCVNHRPGAGWQEARYILLCSNRDYYGSHQSEQVETLLAKEALPILLANPDLVTPDSRGGMTVVAGYTAAEWIEKFQVPWVGIGKPFSPLFDWVRQRFPEIPPNRIMMVGDTLDTDILGGAAQGFATCLTLSGASPGRGETLENLCTQRGIRPDFVVESIAS